MTKDEVMVLENNIKQYLLAEMYSDENPRTLGQYRFARTALINLANELNYTVSIAQDNDEVTLIKRKEEK